MLNVNWEKNSLNNIICHLSWLKKLSPTHTHPLKTICEFLTPYQLLFFELESLINLHKNLLNNFICQLSWLKKLSPTYTHPLVSIHEFSKPCELLFFWVRVSHKMLNVNWEKNSLNNFISHLSWFKKLPPTHTHPLKTSHEFSKPYELLFSELESLIKCWIWIGKKIHSIILSLICHCLRNFLPLIHIPSKPVMHFWNPMSYYFLS